MRRRHAVPNALLPVVTLIAINFGFVLSGAIAVEAIFSWPGLGHATYEAISRSRPADAAGSVPRLQRLGDLLQPARRPGLRLPRPAGAHVVSSVAVTASARRIAWAQAARALPRRSTTMPQSRPGLIGLAVLVVIVAMAIAAPLIASHDNLDPSKTLETPLWASPGAAWPPRNRQCRPADLGSARLRRPDQPAGRSGGDDHRDGDRLRRRHRRRLLRGLVRRRS